MATTPSLTPRDIILQRLARNGVSTPFDGALACVRGLVGIQSQFQQFAEVSIFNRCAPVVSMGELAGLYERHEILNLWGQRNTLHMYTADEWERICDVYGERAGSDYEQTFPDDIAHIHDWVVKELKKHHTLPRERLAQFIDERMAGRLSADDYFEYALIRRFCLRGVFFGQPDKPKIRRYVTHRRVRDNHWRPDPARRDASLRSLAERYFHHYGPATLKDFSHWSGLPQSIAQKSLGALDDAVQTALCGDATYYSVGAPHHAVPDKGTFLLGKFDPLFVSYSHKDWIVPPHLYKAVWRPAGWVEAVIIDNARLAGVWRHTTTGGTMRIQATPFVTASAALKKRVQAKAERLAAFWDKRLSAVEWSS